MPPTQELTTTDHAGPRALSGADADRERIELIKKTVAQGATDAELQLFLYQAKRLGLDPLLGQIKFVKRRRRNRDTNEWEEVGTIMVGIDGLRVLAERTGKYAGQDEPEFEERGDPYPHACTVRVYRKDFPKPLAAKVFWAEYAPLDRNGQPMAMWATKPRFMISKVCEALALRKTFPADLSGLYTEEEFDQDRGEPSGRPSRRPSRAPQRLSAPREPDIDHETGEVLDVPTAPAGRDPEAPSPAPATGADRTALPERTSPTAAPAAPAPGDPAPRPAASTLEDRHALQLLIAQAARAEGFAGRTPGQDWLERHYGARSLAALEDRLGEIRKQAIGILQTHEHATPQEATAASNAGPRGEHGSRTENAASVTRAVRMPTAEFRTLIHKAAVVQGTKGATPGKAWLLERYGTGNPAQLTDAQYTDAVRQALAIVNAVARGPELASPSAIAQLETAFARLQYDEPGRAGLIRACTSDRTDRPEEMTEVEIRALIDELGGPAPGAPADSSATPPAPAA